LFSSSKTVLIMSDDGLQIYFAGKFGVKYLDSIPWETDQFAIAVSDIIVKKAKRQSIIILNDMVEQHYRKERVPNVSILDKANVIQRRLGVAFPSHKVRAALKLKHKTNEDRKTGGSPYLFAAIPNSEAYRLTIQAIEMASVAVQGLYLLPVESSIVVKSLSAKLAKQDKQNTTWTVFAGQHHNGGLRQIVIRDGELALTRMTPIVDTDVEPQLWAKEVSGELTATMSYLARFGYKETDGLRVIVIANDAAKQHLEVRNTNSEFNVITATKAAGLLGVRLGREQEGRYADPIHVAYLSKANKFQLPLKSRAIERLSAPRKVASYILLALTAGCLYFGFSAFQSFKESTSLSDRVVVAQQKRQALQEEYDRELEIKKEMGFDFALVSSSLAVFEEMQKQKMKPLPIMREIGRALGTDIHLDNLLIKLDEVEKEADDSEAYAYGQNVEKEKDYYVDMVLSLSFPSSIDPDIGVERINNLRDRLETNLPPEYDVNITRQVADLSYTGNFVGGEDEQEPEDYIAEIVVRGLVK